MCSHDPKYGGREVQVPWTRFERFLVARRVTKGRIKDDTEGGGGGRRGGSVPHRPRPLAGAAPSSAARASADHGVQGTGQDLGGSQPGSGQESVVTGGQGHRGDATWYVDLAPAWRIPRVQFNSSFQMLPWKAEVARWLRCTP